jgi:hypothetical protein
MQYRKSENLICSYSVYERIVAHKYSKVKKKYRNIPHIYELPKINGTSRLKI